MQYLLIAYDYRDEEALNRRLSVRDQHVAMGDQLVSEGRMLFGTAILDDVGKMVGSMLVLDFPSREELDKWLSAEPYMVGRVWEQVNIELCRVGPSFIGLHR